MPKITFKHTEPQGFYLDAIKPDDHWPVRDGDHLMLVQACNDRHSIVQDNEGYASKGPQRPVPVPTPQAWATILRGHFDATAREHGYGSMVEAGLLSHEPVAQQLVTWWHATRAAIADTPGATLPVFEAA